MRPSRARLPAEHDLHRVPRAVAILGFGGQVARSSFGSSRLAHALVRNNSKAWRINAAQPGSEHSIPARVTTRKASVLRPRVRSGRIAKYKQSLEPALRSAVIHRLQAHRCSTTFFRHCLLTSSRSST